jgi:predicted ATPase
MILIGGEAGIGKTRLLEELGAHAQRQGAPALWGHCTEFEHASPYQPVVEVLRAALPQLALNPMPPLVLAEVARLLPELRERRPDLPDPSRLASEHDQSHLVNALCRCLLGLAYEQPLLVLLEDLHWATESTISWLHALSRQIRFAPVLIAATYRDREIRPGHPLRNFLRGLRREGWGAPLLVPPLAEGATRELIEALSGLGDAASEPAQRLHAESEGNPFFLLELVKHLQEIGQLGQHEGRWVGPWLASDDRERGGAVSHPESVRETIQARLERLSEAARELLGCAAVAGREFDIAVVRAALAWDEEKLLSALDELLERGLVHEHNQPGGRDHRFSHHLIQEVTYDLLPRARCEALHRRLGEAMASTYGETAAPELARHFERGTLHERAIHYLKLAGDQAAARYAVRAISDAIAYYGLALELLASNGSGPAAQAACFDLLMARSQVYRLLGQRPQQRVDLEEAQEVARMLGDKRRQAQIYARWADFYEQITDHAASAQAARNALGLFQAAGDRSGEAQSLHDLGLAAYREGDYRAARGYYEQAVALRQELGDRPGEAASLNLLGNLMRQIGEHATAQAHHEQALALCRDLGDLVGEADSLRSLGALYLFAGKYPLSQAHYEQGLARCRLIGHRRGEAVHLQGLTFLAIVRGAYTAAETYQRAAVCLYEDIGDREGQVWIAVSRGLLAWHLGDLVEARAGWEAALEQAQQLGTRRLQVWAMDNLGNVLRELDEHTPARRYLDEALDHARQAGDRRLEAYSLHHFGQLAWAESNVAEALERWREAAALRQALGLATFAHASRARLAEALVEYADSSGEEAIQAARTVWAAWHIEPPDGEEEDEIRQGYLALARVFNQIGERDIARSCVEQAHAFLESRAAQIADVAVRSTFLTCIPVNAAIQAAWREMAALERTSL